MMPLMPLTHLLRMLRPPQAPPPPASSNGPSPSAASTGSGGYLVTTDGRTLPLRGVSLRADARGGIARVVLEQRFVNPHQEALHVTYLMPLPAEAAVSGYAFVLDGRRIVGEVDKKRAARERFEQAILEGKSAGIVEQERSSLFTQELGNVPPGAEIIAELTLDQRLIWLAEGAWEWRFPTAVGARYTGAAGTVPDAGRIEVAVAEGGVPARLAVALAIRDALPATARPESPSHRVRSSAAGACLDLTLADDEAARLDRDLVVRWPVAAATVGATLDVGRPAAGSASDAAYGLLTLVPPTPDQQRPTRRDLILLLDTSGSMDGDPIHQLKRTSLAMIDTLNDRDTLEMIEFSSSARRWHRGARTATAATRREAREWIEALRAGGGTEMVDGMLEALAPLTKESQRQVVLLTDGYIGGERHVVSAVMAKLPRGSSRVHVVGVGSAVNRTLTAGVARAGAGVELIIAPGEDPERVVGRLLARTASPLVTHVEVRGAAILANAPAYLPDLYAGSPALVSLQLRPEGGELEVSGHTAAGPWRTQLTVPPCAPGQGTAALAKLFARETIEDLELAHSTEEADTGSIDRAIEELGLRFQISTRLTTWVAISHEATVDPSRPGRREVMPHELPHGVSAEGLGLRAPMAAPGQAAPRTMAAYSMPGAPMGAASASMGPPPMGAGAMARPRAARAASSSELRGGGGRSPSESNAEGGVSFSDVSDDEAESGSAFEEPTSAKAAARPAPPPAAARPAPSSTSASAPAKKESAKDTPVDAARQGSREEKASAPRDEGARRLREQERAVPPGLVARLRHRAGTMLVLELRADVELDWQPGSQVILRLADGRDLTVKVLPATTAAGTYRDGQLLRLVIELDPATISEALIAVTVAGRRIPIVME